LVVFWDALRRMYPDLITTTIRGIEEIGGAVSQNSETDLLTVNDEFTASPRVESLANITFQVCITGRLNLLVRVEVLFSLAGIGPRPFFW
jgi:hypothetical protein